MSNTGHFRSSPRPQVAHQITLERPDRPEEKPIVAYTRDISTGGLFVEEVEDLQLGEKLLVTLSSPTTWEPLTLMAEVRRVEPGDDKRKAGVGLHFFDVTDTQLVALIELTTSLDFEG